MTSAPTMIVPSNIPHLPDMDAFAATGPTMHSMNADEHPRNARISLNLGTRIDIITHPSVMQIRCTMRSLRLRFSRDARARDILLVSSCGEGWGTSMCSKISSVAVSGCVVSANFDLRFNTVEACLEVCGITYKGLSTSIQSAKWFKGLL